jgi:hypothetical protein
MAIPSSRVVPLNTCPALRPRWCPASSPFRFQDCCLPSFAQRRLSQSFLLVILRPQHYSISGLYYTACVLVPPSFIRPLLVLHVGLATDLLARL